MAATTVREPERTAASRHLHLVHRPRFVLLGGVPGAGKTTLLEALAVVRPDVTTVDPDRLRRRIAAALPGVPYTRYRPVVHLCTTVVVLALVLRGPTPTRCALVVHDPATRRTRRSLTGRLARWRGWDPTLVVLDVSRAAALGGQLARRRVLARDAFDRHWRRWEEERPRLTASSCTGRGEEPWSSVRVVKRSTALPEVTRLLG